MNNNLNYTNYNPNTRNEENIFQNKNSKGKKLKIFTFIILIIGVLGYCFYKYKNKEEVLQYEEYIVTFELNKASKVDDKYLSCITYDTNGCSIIMPSITAKEGYEVLGWSEDKDATYATYLIGDSYIIDKNTTLYAITKPVSKVLEYTIKFEVNTALKIDDSKLSCKTSENSCSIRMPSITAKEGYKVLGWSEDKNAKNASYLVGSTYTINKNITLYAITEHLKNSKTFTINFDKNNAESIKNDVLTCSTTENTCFIMMPFITPPSDYEVIGWAENKNETKNIYLVGQEYEISKDMQLYAILRKKQVVKEYTITFNKNTASSIGNTSLSCQSAEDSCGITMPSITAKSGYEVIGWSTSSTASSAEYEVGKTYQISQNITLYAITKIIPKKYTITFNKNTASSIGNTSLSCQSAEDSCGITMPSITAKSGYEVIGWSTSSTASSAEYEVGKTYQISQNITLYAITKIIPKKYTITFNKNTASSIGNTSLSCETTGDSCNITMPSITAKSGYEAVGWSTSGSSTTAEYEAGKSYSISKNITLYAITKVAPKKYTVTFNKNTASSIGSTSLSCETTEDSCSITMPSITVNSGYEAVGWATSSTASSVEYEVGKSYSINKNITLYAITKEKLVNGFLSGTALSNFKSANNVNTSDNIVVQKTTQTVSGISFTVYYVYDEENYTSSELSDFKTFAQNSLNNLSTVSTKTLKYIKSYGTNIIFFGNYTCDAALVNKSDYTYAAYCNSINRNVVVGYEPERLNWEYYETSIVHEFGHAFDFSLRYSIIGDTQAGISGLTQSNIQNGFTNRNNTFISSSKVIDLFIKDSSDNPYSWPDLATNDASNLKSGVSDFTAYDVDSLISRPNEFFADVFSAYYLSTSQKSSMKSIAPNTYAAMEKLINYIN